MGKYLQRIERLHKNENVLFKITVRFNHDTNVLS